VEHDLVRPGRRPEADGFRDRVRITRDGGGAGPPHRLEPPRRVRAGHGQQVEDHRVRAGPAGRRAGLVDRPARGPHPLDRAA
jgi:hypothetical protein